MALRFPDMVAETSVTTGTNDMELAGAVAGFRAYSDVLSDGDTVPYAISYGDEFETGLGTWNETTGRLERTTVFQSSNNNNKVSFSSGTKKVIVGPLGRHINPGLASKSADYTVVAADFGAVIAVDASGAARTVTLPPAATAGAGFRIVVKKTDGSFNTVTIVADGSETIDGAATFVLRLPNQSVTLICDSTKWYVLDEAGTEYRGSNGNGSYVRYASGVQKCWGTITFTGGDTATVSATWNYPAPFSAAPFSTFRSTAAPAAGARERSYWGNAPGTSSSLFAMSMNANFPSGFSETAVCSAEGVWF
ncbi:hypothetical protein [Shinella pollutisoli]|uniref:Uncharacterized protein n=1 Tax=Shinella pollutisoli TaxID=2250594 RepID=A0ABV7DIF6_9HYPH|nr:hypothetical protein [Shinella pollutisoli]